MKRSRFSEDQIIEIPKEHEAGVAELCRKHGSVWRNAGETESENKRMGTTASALQ